MENYLQHIQSYIQVILLAVGVCTLLIMWLVKSYNNDIMSYLKATNEILTQIRADVSEIKEEVFKHEEGE